MTRLITIPAAASLHKARIQEIDDHLNARAGRHWFHRLLTWPIAVLLRSEREKLTEKIADLRRRYRGREKI